MKDVEQLLNTSTFLQEAALDRTALPHFERMGFITPPISKFDRGWDDYYPRKDARRIRLMQTFLLGKDGPVKNLRQAHEQACKQIP
jgi:hypothetical protein